MNSCLPTPPAPTSATFPIFQWPPYSPPLQMDFSTSPPSPTTEPTANSPVHPGLLNQPSPTTPRPRLIVLCFDGPGNKFGENSNIVRFFKALVKEKPGEQIVYYQPGSGAYNKASLILQVLSTMISKSDVVVPLHLDDQIKNGYRFIVQSYRQGDKICLFGFSRGAHIARAIAGMVYKVGILPIENIQQLDFAFNMYATTGYHGYKLSREFKQTFSIPTKPVVEFVGVWDTPSSVGVIPQTYPYTSINYAVKTFRHALALDERRAGFRPDIWTEPTSEYEQTLDVDIPEPEPIARHTRDMWEYEPPNRDHADVKEVWFAGCHADVGGGSHKAQRDRSLSSVSLRWMIKECILTGTGILFDMKYLKESLAFDFQNLSADMDRNRVTIADLGETYRKIKEYSSKSPTQQFDERPNEGQLMSVDRHAKQRARDICDDIFDQIILTILWWFLELIPLLFTHQNWRGDWVRIRIRNLGQGRYIPYHQNGIQVHESVRERIEGTKENGKSYTPKARNWDEVSKSSMLRYID